MTTPRTRSLVSLAATLTLALALGGCATAAARPLPAVSNLDDVASLAIHFDNGARDYVHVYLIGARREWMLGGVAPGAHATLRLPDEALAEGVGFVRLAVLPGQHVSLSVSREPRAAISMFQPAAGLLAQRWSFSQVSADGQLLGR